MTFTPEKTLHISELHLGFPGLGLGTQFTPALTPPRHETQVQLRAHP